MTKLLLLVCSVFGFLYLANKFFPVKSMETAFTAYGHTFSWMLIGGCAIAFVAHKAIK